MAENKCEGCICIGCRFKDTDDCFHTDLCIDCAKEYTTMLCPSWKKKEQKNDGRKTMAENKMEQVAKLFGKELGERFTVERDHDRFDCRFMPRGFETFCVYENPYLDFDCFILEDLLTGRAVIVDE